MNKRFVNMLRGLSTNWVGSLGVALTTTAFVLFLFIEILRVLGIVTSSYIGLVSYLALPALFVLGLILIPFGWSALKRATGKTTRELMDERFEPSELESRAFGSRIVRMFFLLTLVNILFLGAGTARMLHFMETPKFCGTACHGVMEPEWTTYQASPHAHVRCVDCHVGDGAGALIDSKINGLKQMVSATFKLYERPIPTPVRQLRPARETCEHCHWPDKFYGDRLVEKVRYDFDEASTPRYTTLSLKVGSGQGQRRGEIHWHVAERNEVRYASVDDEREEILWVESRQADGTWKRFERRDRTAGAHDAVRVMDCVDCHNRATHIYEDPEKAVDERMASGEIPTDIPFIKARALAALTGSYADADAAMQGIDAALAGWYRTKYPKRTAEFAAGLDRATASLQAAWKRNVHPGMNVTWGAYPSHLGHDNGGGCFRCHTPELQGPAGESISNDCTLCHSILAEESPHPFQFLLPVAEKGDPDAGRHKYLQEEFLNTLNP
ncbi:MAG TPA: NapC/NirT family cytochrome c [Candidatus Krumholzibacteria bacterium]|nr:NapC/NirT family cytochrome c [Candidatus Krumholzibacteria bacterium]HRX50002.1 NapC/NirT family cytochrome c [Candidatus Krumholzibacteria bacterium]